MKTILVTGASSGIGRALAVRAARAGYAVYAVGRNGKALAALAAQVGEENGVIVVDATDISDPANAPGLIGRAVGAFGRIDVLVNNAGIVATGPIATQSDEQLLAQFGTHVVGPLALVREAMPALRTARGHVFMVGSGVARIPVGGLGAYPPSKAALRSATTILRRELTPLDVAVTYVDPGAVDTMFMTRAGMPGAPQNVLVSPELVARKILFAVETRPRVLNVAPLQTAAITLAEMLPGVTEAILEHNPSLVGAGPTLAYIDAQRDANGRGEKIALPSSLPIESPEAGAEPLAEPVAESVAPLDTDEDIDDGDVDLDDEPESAAGETETQGVAAEPSHEDAPVAVAVTLAAAETAAAPDLVESAAVQEAAPAAVATPAPAPAEDAEIPYTGRWQYEPPEVETVAPPPAAVFEVPAEAPAPAPHNDLEEILADGDGPTDEHDDEPAPTTSSFDAALEPLLRRMERGRLHPGFVRSLLVPDAVLDVGESASRWAGMPNKHERALTSEVFFALAEWGFLAPRADGRYRVLRAPDDPVT